MKSPRILTLESFEEKMQKDNQAKLAPKEVGKEQTKTLVKCSKHPKNPKMYSKLKKKKFKLNMDHLKNQALPSTN